MWNEIVRAIVERIVTYQSPRGHLARQLVRLYDILLETELAYQTAVKGHNEGARSNDYQKCLSELWEIFWKLDTVLDIFEGDLRDKLYLYSTMSGPAHSPNIGIQTVEGYDPESFDAARQALRKLITNEFSLEEILQAKTETTDKLDRKLLS